MTPRDLIRSLMFAGSEASEDYIDALERAAAFDGRCFEWDCGRLTVEEGESLASEMCAEADSLQGGFPRLAGIVRSRAERVRLEARGILPRLLDRISDQLSERMRLPTGPPWIQRRGGGSVH